MDKHDEPVRLWIRRMFFRSAWGVQQRGNLANRPAWACQLREFPKVASVLKRRPSVKQLLVRLGINSSAVVPAPVSRSIRGWIVLTMSAPFHTRPRGDRMEGEAILRPSSLCAPPVTGSRFHCRYLQPLPGPSALARTSKHEARAHAPISPLQTNSAK
jgi:hypothetical protein